MEAQINMSRAVKEWSIMMVAAKPSKNLGVRIFEATKE